MTWSGQPVTVTRQEIRETIKRLANELGLVATCAPCGSARFCTGPFLEDDFQQFVRLHAGHSPKR